MNIEALYNHCLSLPDTRVDTPFGPEVLAFRVMDKIFALVALDENPLRINLKCEPEKAIALRETYGFVLPGYHMNKKHWNTVILEDTLPDTLLKDWIFDSYTLVKPKSKKKPAAK
ncbi:MAG: MmcQ/YjbR family DNA-binding protein [Schleiferiaceae bacterium]|nr:MmcQ/YjbR family DNA-binding protein [Schleiferiaceae bacterium]